MTTTPGFGVNNLPWGVASCSLHPEPSCVTRINDSIVFLKVLQDNGYFAATDGLPHGIFAKPVLNDLAALSQTTRRKIRATLQSLLNSGDGDNELPQGSVLPIHECKLYLPIQAGDFTDFSCSKEHNWKASEVVLGAPSLPPAFYYYPGAYTGQSSSIVVSGTPIYRPVGCFYGSSGNVEFGPSNFVDYELEMACVIGKPVAFGQRPTAEEAAEHIFGYTVLNDWSARDHQSLEMRPLGPLNSKSFGTTFSPWIVDPDALHPFRTPAPPFVHPPAPYLDRKDRMTPSVSAKVEIQAGGTSTVVSTVKLEWLYWTFEDMIAHQAINGCPLRTGDILASGTISGVDQEGCLAETTRGGKNPFKLNDGSSRSSLKDGDVIAITAWSGNGDEDRPNSLVSFGECVGELRSAVPWAKPTA